MKPNRAICLLADLDIRSGCSRGRAAGFTYITGGERYACRLFSFYPHSVIVVRAMSSVSPFGTSSFCKAQQVSDLQGGLLHKDSRYFEMKRGVFTVGE